MRKNSSRTYTSAASKGEEIEVPVRYMERLDQKERESQEGKIGGRRMRWQGGRAGGTGERERVEVKADGRTDGRRIPDKWIKRKLLNSV